MGITKRPSSSCSDEINIRNCNGEIVILLSDSSSSDEGSDNEVYSVVPTIIDSVEYYRNLLPELRLDADINSTSFETKPVALKKKNIPQMGRRKANRAQNEIFLLSLIDDQQQYPEDEIFYNDNKNSFTKAINKLGTRPDLKELFIEGNDEIVLQKGNKRSSAKKNNKSKRSRCPDVAFKNLTTSQKSLFKQKSLPFTVIDQLETEVVQYFTQTPNGVYMSGPLPSYHRMLLHSIVRYYSLEATSMNSRGRRAQKIIQVRNSHYDNFQPPQISLLQFISKPNCC